MRRWLWNLIRKRNREMEPVERGLHSRGRRNCVNNLGEQSGTQLPRGQIPYTEFYGTQHLRLLHATGAEPNGCNRDRVACSDATQPVLVTLTMVGRVLDRPTYL